jgi:hypothetical protein
MPIDVKCFFEALIIDGVPIDVVAERVQATRGEVYQTLYGSPRTPRALIDTRGVCLS